MNKRQTKKFCKKGGHYHFDKTIKRISHKKMMYPYVATAYVNNHCISWHEIGTCLTCAKCTDVNIDWDGTPYMWWGDNCGGADNFTCKRYELDPDIRFFKYMDIKSTSPDSELKRYIEENIKNLHKDNEPDSNEVYKPFKDPNSLLEALGLKYDAVRDKIIPESLDKEDLDKFISELRKVNNAIDFDASRKEDDDK